MEKTEADVDKLNEEFQSVTGVIERLAVHFGEEPKNFNVDECFALLGHFFGCVEAVAKVRSTIIVNLWLLYNDVSLFSVVGQRRSRPVPDIH